jgi:TDG/mug DNA glycosylase family protein
VGSNPGLRSARLGHYYAGRGNQFWPFLGRAGLVRPGWSYEDDARLVDHGMGLTDLVKRPTPSANDLRQEDYRKGRALLRRKLARYRPAAVAFVGKGVFERFRGEAALLGSQAERLGGARVFVLPSTSAANASLSRGQKFRYFSKLARWLASAERTSAHHKGKQTPWAETN